MADAQELPSITRLIDARRAEKTRFIVIGMTAAILQGTPATTLDIDLWIDLPPRQYIRLLNLARRLGAEIVANTVVVLPDHVTINFVYGEVIGLNSFKTEYKKIRLLRWMRRSVPVLPLERVYRSKQMVGRPKDLAHLPAIEQTLALKRKARRPKRPH